MGINKQSYDAISSILDKVENKDKKILIELGIQESYFNSDFKFLRDKISIFFMNYLSLDLHDISGVTKFDLSVYQPDKFKADVITNIGTSEHVEYEDGQYNCWKNMHHWLNVGGLVIHELPEINSWPNHCRYFTTLEFFQNLENYGYELLELKYHVHEQQGNLIWSVLKKVRNTEFMSKEDFFSKMIIDKNVTSDKIDYRNNPKNLNIR